MVSLCLMWLFIAQKFFSSSIKANLYCSNQPILHKTNKLKRCPCGLNPGVLEIYATIAKLLKRLLPGEDPNQTLFTDLLKGLTISS